MSRKVTKAAYFSLGGTDYSAYVKKVAFKANGDEVDVTTMGDAGWKVLLQGLKSFDISVDFNLDSDFSGIDAAVWAVLIHASTNTMAFEVRPDQAAVGTTNPKITGNVLITEGIFGDFGVGEALAKSITFKGTGTPTRATS